MKTQIKHVGDGRENVTLWIDSYDDVFSDFDPRPFSERMISDDFVGQVKRVIKEKSDKVSVLNLLVPEAKQNEEEERVIKKRLQSYFYNVSFQISVELKKIRMRGLAFTFFGISSMITASYIAFLQLPGFSYKLILTLFEPGGWFLFWTGLDLIISISGSRKNESHFYKKMENIHVEFSSYK